MPATPKIYKTFDIWKATYDVVDGSHPTASQ